MTRIAKALTDLRIKTAKPSNKTYKLTDSDDLYLDARHRQQVLEDSYTQANQKKTCLSFGAYPVVILTDAREKSA